MNEKLNAFMTGSLLGVLTGEFIIYYFWSHIHISGIFITLGLIFICYYILNWINFWDDKNE